MKTLISPFRIVLIFSVLAITAWFTFPYLKVDFLPESKTSSLVISFTLPNSSPDIVEQQVTSILEGGFSQMSELKNIYSVSRYNSGYIELQFGGKTDLQYKQFETAGIIRQLYSKLPATASYPVILRGNGNVKEKSPLLIYTIAAPVQSFRIKEEAEKVFRKAFAGLAGVKELRIAGDESPQLTIRFDKVKCSAYGVDAGNIGVAVQSYFAPYYPGSAAINSGQQVFLKLNTPDAFSILDLEDILLPAQDSSYIQLGKVASINVEESEPQGYFRVNGNQTITLAVYPKEGENKVLLGQNIRNLMKEYSSKLPREFEVLLEYDDTTYLEKEISKNNRRALLAVSILLSFIFIAYRKWQNVVVLLLSLVVNLLLTTIAAWASGITIHLYTIAGIAISFGIMIDNAIVMLDHYYRWRNKKIFLAIMGSTLTTVAALCLVFFLPPEEKKNLIDFAAIIVTALLTSLITALWFTPAIHSLLTAKKTKPVMNADYTSFKKKRPWQAHATNRYYSLISFLARFRKTFMLLVTLIFGLPFFMLPPKWEGSSWYNNLYNQTIGSKFYQEKIRPHSDKWTGGFLRNFINQVYERSTYRSPEKTKLFIAAELPYGNTPDQMNFILGNFEQFLSSVKGVEKYVTVINSGQYGSIEVSFRKAYESSNLPYQLKAKLINMSLDWGGVEWNIYGVGQGFSNAGGNETPNFRVVMMGYNYDELEKLAEKFGEKLRTHKRVQKVNTNERLDFSERQSQEYVLKLDANQMALYNTSRLEVLRQLSQVTKPLYPTANIPVGNNYFTVFTTEKNASSFSNYQLLQNPLIIDTARTVRVANLGNISLIPVSSSIHKENRQYIRVIGFEYMGPEKFGSKFLTGLLEEQKKVLPVGYTAEEKKIDWNWSRSGRKYVLIVILLLSIFFICSVLFENMKQPFHIIAIIPVSFIGLFLTFTWGGYYFDQGGYAAFVMLGGLVANAAIFIVNDFNNLRKQKSVHLYNKALVKATAGRARTVILTTISTCCGLLPFLLEGQNEVFWFSLAAGTIGGLLFSLFALFIVLPVLLWKKKLKSPTRSVSVK